MTLYTVCYLEKEDEILMLYRNKKENDINEGKWLGVGGHVEYGESPYECAIREIKEETGLTASNLVFRGHISFFYNGKSEYLYVFSSRDFQGKLVDECNEGELHWIKRNEIKKLNMWKSDYSFMNKIIEKDYNIFMLKAVYDGDELIEYKEEI